VSHLRWLHSRREEQTVETLSFTQEQYVAKLREVVADRGDDYVYGDGEHPCSYIPASYPDQQYANRASNDRCVHGETLSRLGVPDSTLRTFEGATVPVVLRELMAKPSSDFRDDMARLQRLQDKGEPYRYLAKNLVDMDY
jgi:hypothetical protein